MLDSSSWHSVLARSYKSFVTRILLAAPGIVALRPATIQVDGCQDGLPLGIMIREWGVETANHLFVRPGTRTKLTVRTQNQPACCDSLHGPGTS